MFRKGFVGSMRRQDSGVGASYSFQSIGVRYNNAVWKDLGEGKVRSRRPNPTRASVGSSGGAHVGSRKENNN